jgi:hypothetical protein
MCEEARTYKSKVRLHVRNFEAKSRPHLYMIIRKTQGSRHKYDTYHHTIDGFGEPLVDLSEGTESFARRGKLGGGDCLRKLHPVRHAVFEVAGSIDELSGSRRNGHNDLTKRKLGSLYEGHLLP